MTRGETRAPDARRIRLLSAALAAACTLAVARLVEVAMSAPPVEPTEHAVRHAAASRADIVDRRGELLARDLWIHSIWADPADIWDPRDAADILSAVFPDVDATSLAADLAADRQFVWVKRGASPKRAQMAFDLGLGGVHLLRERRRVYPQGRLASHLIGHVDVDNVGRAGLERALEDRLRGDPETPVRLTLDARVQAELEAVLADALIAHRALGAAGVVLDARTGDVLALASMPDHDPHRPGQAPLEGRRNRATLEVYELGSVFKTFSVAAVLDAGVARLGDAVDAAKPLEVADRVIHDFHPENRMLTISEVLIHSSNIGSAKLALDAGAETIRTYYRRFGLLDALEAPFPEAGRPMTPRRWGPTETATVSYGHGLAVTPLHVAVAAGAVFTDGVVRPPRFVVDDDAPPRPAVRAISETTATIMQALLRRNVVEGTGRSAAVPGYDVLGKTGTAEKVSPLGGYDEDRLVTSFLAAFPGHAPRYVTYVMLDEPQPTARSRGYATAGWNAGPATADLIERIAPILGVERRIGDVPGQVPEFRRAALREDER